MLCHVELCVIVSGITWGDSQGLMVSMRIVSVWHCVLCVAREAVLCVVPAVYVAVVCVGNFCVCDCVIVGWSYCRGSLQRGVLVWFCMLVVCSHE